MIFLIQSELFVKVVDVEDILKVNRLEGYTSSVRSATWDPSGTLLVCRIQMTFSYVTDGDCRQHAPAMGKSSSGIWLQIRQSLKRVLKG